ncbi:MAG TPA: deoxynucleoside kinase [Anaerolineales bacterium]|nr:deoxynucleoside kinase [Anaerolineales bacterium]
MVSLIHERSASRAPARAAGLHHGSPSMYVAIEGVIGVGKTTLARLLQPVFNAEILLEVFEENPFLSDFYADRERYAFQTQIFFLLSRYHQQRRTVHEMLASGKDLFADYTFAKDALFAQINLKGDELDMYYKVHEALAEKIQKPDLLVYLQASTDTLMQRIALRDRTYERQMERSYIDELNHAYDSFYAKPFDGTPVLTIETDSLNIIQNPEHLKVIENRIRQSLKLHPFQPSLPLP